MDFLWSRVPTNARLFLETIFGKKDRITEKDFKQDELKFIEDAIRTSMEFWNDGRTKGAVKYEDWLNNRVNPGWGLDTLWNPNGRAMTSLGKFNYNYDAANDSYRVKDTYDFNPRSGPSYGETPLYTLLRDFGGARVPPGKGRDVELNFPAQYPRSRTAY